MKCIYCNNDMDLTISDIIPAALTGAKVKKKFVCRKHNSFTNDHYEKKMIDKLAIFRNRIGLTERSGDPVRYKANLIIGNYTSEKEVYISDNNSIMDANRLFRMKSENGQKILVGPKKQLLKKQGIQEDSIDDLLLPNISISKKTDIRELFISEVTLHTVAKIAYEWHCFINNIEEFQQDKYSNITSYILNPIQNNSIVEVVNDVYIAMLLEQFSRIGSNMLFEYLDRDGNVYVIFNLWNVITYKVKVTSHNEKNIKMKNYLTVYFYHADRTKKDITFGVLGEFQVVSLPPLCGMSMLAEKIKSRLSNLGNRDLSYEYLKNCIYNTSKKLLAYQENKISIDELLDFSNKDVIIPIYIIEQLYIHKDEYLLTECFYKNMKRILQTDNRYLVSTQFLENILERYLKMDREGTFGTMLEKALNYFESINIDGIAIQSISV